uniref:Apple domain-containing protein n=1 Tax=Schistosoma mansoni TaxID=6183 RepID=A0A5K4F7V3_SCHMA
MHCKLHHSFIITVLISIYLFDCLHTQTNLTNNFTLLSSCRKCSTCNTNMHCNYTQWISISGLPMQSFLQTYWLKTVETKSDCLIVCRFHPQCKLYTHKAIKQEFCKLYSGLMENTTIDTNSTDHYVTGGRVCCCKFKSLFVYYGDKILRKFSNIIN